MSRTTDDVPVGARVAGRRERESLALERGSGGEARERLHRLQARARKDRRRRCRRAWRPGCRRDRGRSPRRCGATRRTRCVRRRRVRRRRLRRRSAAPRQPTAADPGPAACQTGAMFGEHRYGLRTTWTGDRGTGTSGYRDYDRVRDDRDRRQARSARVLRQALPRRPEPLEPRGPAARGAQRVPSAVVPARVRAGGRRGRRRTATMRPA